MSGKFPMHEPRGLSLIFEDQRGPMELCGDLVVIERDYQPMINATSQDYGMSLIEYCAMFPDEFISTIYRKSTKAFIDSWGPRVP